jgi:hypothetical protein
LKPDEGVVGQELAARFAHVLEKTRAILAGSAMLFDEAGLSLIGFSCGIPFQEQFIVMH